MVFYKERIYQYAQERMLGLLRLPLPDAYKGRDALQRLAERIVHDGCRHVFIVCGKTVTKHGLVDGFTRELAGLGIRTTVWDGAIPNPTVKNVEEGVAAFETHDAFALFGLVHQQLVDVFLFHGMVARCLAHIDVFGIFRRPAQNAVIGQTVIDHNIGHLKAIHCLHADKPVISGACTY